MPWYHAVLLGIVEALTEFLPVSSTGHLLLVNAALGHDDKTGDTLSIVIQLGAVLAVVVYFRKLLLDLAKGLRAREPGSVRLFIALAIGFFPAAITGYLFHDAIEQRLFGPRPIAWALIVGGVLMIGVDRWARGRQGAAVGLEHIGPGRALAVGLAQVLALWPGASRSMTTIVGGQAAGLDAGTAAQFSFLLSIPLLGAASVFSMVKNRDAILAAPGGLASLGIGMATAFLVSLVVIGGFLRYLRRFGLGPFGVYRILLGIFVLWTMTD
jgi:undecaprenyl-diphosphatase